MGRGGYRAGLAVQGATRYIERCFLCRGRTYLRQMEPVVVLGLPADGNTRSEIDGPKV